MTTEQMEMSTAAASVDAASIPQRPVPPPPPTESDAAEVLVSDASDALAATNKTNRNIMFHISLLYNLMLHHDTSRPWWSRVQPYLLLGALPLKEKNHLAMLTETEGVRAIVTMNQAKELLPNWLGTPVTPAEWAKANVLQCFGHTGDFTPPTIATIQRCVAFVHENVEAKRTTYVHCKAGRGRSTVIVLAYLMQHHSMTLDQAHAFVVSRRRHISLHPKQRAILSEFASTL